MSLHARSKHEHGSNMVMHGNARNAWKCMESWWCLQSGAGIPVVSGLLKYKQTGQVMDLHHGGGAEGGGGMGMTSSCGSCGYWKEKHDQLRSINKGLNDQLAQLGSQHNTLKDVVRSVTPYLEK